MAEIINAAIARDDARVVQKVGTHSTPSLPPTLPPDADPRGSRPFDRLAAGAEAGVEHRFVEHDFPPEPYWPSVAASLGYLRGLG
jgi:hypothetical protein